MLWWSLCRAIFSHFSMVSHRSQRAWVISHYEETCWVFPSVETCFAGGGGRIVELSAKRSTNAIDPTFLILCYSSGVATLNSPKKQSLLLFILLYFCHHGRRRKSTWIHAALELGPDAFGEKLGSRCEQLARSKVPKNFRSDFSSNTVFPVRVVDNHKIFPDDFSQCSRKRCMCGWTWWRSILFGRASMDLLKNAQQRQQQQQHNSNNPF